MSCFCELKKYTFLFGRNYVWGGGGSWEEAGPSDYDLKKNNHNEI